MDRSLGVAAVVESIRLLHHYHYHSTTWELLLCVVCLFVCLFVFLAMHTHTTFTHTHTSSNTWEELTTPHLTRSNSGTKTERLDLGATRICTQTSIVTTASGDFLTLLGSHRIVFVASSYRYFARGSDGRRRNATQEHFSAKHLRKIQSLVGTLLRFRSSLA
jgi:hypothetical protein